ncbi:hypothetical protein [Burkholderia latens]|uniref:Elongation factor Tu n=1 Tax=Burkholderia latens TaxID=488446 RepID=A0A6H9SYD4_9BURK|nr:hypothetical protein [Burkholderia latens]KAB0641127.1 hypothetical protein F7R21_16185 [Burkholderia latens]VWB59174.1 hypothetical protein BLA24064_02729 [Burkholderia latens]
MENIIATVEISIDVPDPKVSGVRTGYSPHHKFARIDWLASGKHVYDDTDVHYPGETLKAKIKFASWEHMRDSVGVGDHFEILENDRLIGHGVVDAIL